MIEFVLNVRDLEAGHRQTLEQLMGTRLSEDQEVFIMAYTRGRSAEAIRREARALCNTPLRVRRLELKLNA